MAVDVRDSETEICFYGIGVITQNHGANEPMREPTNKRIATLFSVTLITKVF